MSLLPIATTRTSTPLTTQRLLFQLNNDQLALQRQYDQLSTGQRVLRLSDDPAAANRAIQLHRGIDNSTQVLRNANSAQSFYQAADTALARVDNALIEARGVAVQGAQTVISDDERAALATSIQQSIQSVLAASNTMFRDHQMLGGILNSGNAFEYDGNEVVFTGKVAVGKSELGAGTPNPINVTANEALGAYSVFMEGGSLNAALDRETRLVDLRQGRGVSPGVLSFSGGGNFVEVDMQTAATMGDVVDLISDVELDGRPLTASITPDGIRIEYTDGLAGTLAIADGIGSTTARELAISNPQGVQAPPIIGDRLSPRVTPATKVADLAGGAGIDLSAGIQIQQGDRTFAIDFEGAEDLSDVLIAINRSGADVKAELDEAQGSINLRALRSGVDFSVGENGGSVATELGIRSATGATLVSELGRGRGLVLNTDSPDLEITRPDGTVIQLDLEGVETIDDVIEAIARHPSNQDTRRMLASLNDFGNGLQIVAPPGAGNLVVRALGVSNAGVRLGLIPEGETRVEGRIDGAVNTLVGTDYSPRDAGGALDTLIRLQAAVADSNQPEIERLQAKLDTDLDTASRTRGRVGVWSANLSQLETATEDGIVAMRSQLSDEVDADLATVISELNARQASLEASMRFIGQTAQLTVLNFL